MATRPAEAAAVAAPVPRRPRAALQILRDEHGALAAVLRSLETLAAQGPGGAPERFFDVMRAMLFYIDEFPERLHHPAESDLLFPKLVRALPHLMPVVQRLEADHLRGEARVRELQHLLLAWELLGEARRPAFTAALSTYVGFYLEHMRLEEKELLSVAPQALTEEDWDALDDRFRSNRDPLVTGDTDVRYDRLFTRIVLSTPAPLGLGPALDGG